MAKYSQAYCQIGTDRVIGIDYASMRNYRLAKIRAWMKEKNIGLYVTFDAWNMRYLNGGYPTVPCRWASSMFSILCQNDEPILSATTVMNPFRLADYYPWLPEGHVTKDIGGAKAALKPEQWYGFRDYMINLMEKFGVRHLPVALDHCPNADIAFEVMRQAGLTVINPMEDLAKIRLQKDDNEIACMRISCAVAEAAMWSCQKAMHPAIRENELTAIGVREQYCHATDEVVPPNIISGWRTNPMHTDFTDRLILAGDLIAVHMDDVCFNGYKSSLGRTFVIGKATDEQKQAYQIAYELMQKAIAQIKPGNTTKDITSVWPHDPAFWNCPDRNSAMRCAHGNGIGMMFEDAPYFSAMDGDDAEAVTLLPGMTFALETWYGPKDAPFGASIKETVLVTEDGCEILTHYPSDKIIEVPLGQ